MHVTYDLLSMKHPLAVPTLLVLVSAQPNWGLQTSEGFLKKWLGACHMLSLQWHVSIQHTGGIAEMT